MKPKAICSVACLAVLSLLAGCAFNMGSAGVKGSGIVTTESRAVAGFSSISLGSIGRVTVRQTGQESLTISAEDNILPLLESRVTDRTLHLDIVKEAAIDPTRPIEYVVEVKDLEGLKVAGAGSIEAVGIQAKRLAVSLSGVGNVKLAGNAEALELDISGVGGFQGEDLKIKQATVRSIGVGNAVINASEQLDASVSGVGSVEYIGSPKVRESVSGAGSVKKR